uniref:CBM11 domain-containing protein n=1 Tax=Gracilinema caldarium TaxID=215591 RepID=A0A7C3IRP1_9SPIR
MKKAKLFTMAAALVTSLVVFMGCPQPTSGGGGGGGGGETYVGDAVAAYNEANYYVYLESTTGVQDNDSELYAFDGTCALADATSTGSGIPEGSVALKVTNTGSAAGWSAGGWTTATSADMSAYNALVFYVLAKPTEFNGQLKVKIGGTSESPEIAVQFTADGTWKKVQVHLDQFTGIDKTAITKPFIFVSEDTDFNDIFYLDNIYYTHIDGFTYTPPTIPSPTTVPPTPSESASNVISILSQGTYTDVTGTNWGTDWDAAECETISVNTATNIKKITLTGWGLGVEGWTTFDITGKTTLHIDYWTANGTALSIKVVDFGNDGSYDGGDDKEITVPLTTVTQNNWTGVDLDFSGLETKGHIAQILVLPNGGAANQIYYFGNMYFK